MTTFQKNFEGQYYAGFTHWHKPTKNDIYLDSYFTTPHISDIYKESGARVQQKYSRFIEGKITNMALSGQRECENNNHIKLLVKKVFALVSIVAQLN